MRISWPRVSLGVSLAVSAAVPESLTAPLWLRGALRGAGHRCPAPRAAYETAIEAVATL